MGMREGDGRKFEKVKDMICVALPACHLDHSLECPLLSLKHPWAYIHIQSSVFTHGSSVCWGLTLGLEMSGDHISDIAPPTSHIGVMP